MVSTVVIIIFISLCLSIAKRKPLTKLYFTLSAVILFHPTPCQLSTFVSSPVSLLTLAFPFRFVGEHRDAKNRTSTEQPTTSQALPNPQRRGGGKKKH